MAERFLMTDYKYYAHDWILDVERVIRLETIHDEFIPVCKEFSVRFIEMYGTTSEGFRYIRLVTGVSSQEALTAFEKVAAKWNFVGWTSVTTDEVGISSITDAHWEILARYMQPESRPPDFPVIHDGLWSFARENERLRNKLSAQSSGLPDKSSD